jgi:hypothetical protein
LEEAIGELETMDPVARVASQTRGTGPRDAVVDLARVRVRAINKKRPCALPLEDAARVGPRVESRARAPGDDRTLAPSDLA